MTNPIYFPNTAPATLLNQLSPGDTAQLLYEFSSCLSRFFPARRAQQTETQELQSQSGRIRSLLIRIGFPPHLYGFRYLTEAVLMCMENPILLKQITLNLYPAIAEKMNVTPGSVERCIRHSITTAWERQKPGFANELLGRNVISCYEKPSNSEMIAALVEFLTRNEE